MRIVVIGGVAAGMSAASQAKRREPSAEVIALERTSDVSYGACGIPYNLMDAQRPIDDLVVISAERFQGERGIDVRTGQAAESIAVAAKQLSVRDLRTGELYTLAYDKLIIATGAEAVRPNVPGLSLEGVFTLRTLQDGARLKRYLEAHAPKRALLVGAGYIGMEMAEALRARGLEVRVVEKAPQLLPGFDAAIAGLVESELRKQGVSLHLNAGVQAIERASSGSLLVRTDQETLETELVLLAVGVRPNVALARQAGVKLGPSGAIAVDDHQRTNLPDVYAAGDCAEAFHLVSGRPAWIPLGTTANKQGKVAGANATGGDERFGGLVGSAAFKVFDLEVGRTGLGRSELEQLGIDFVSALSLQVDHARSFGGEHMLTTLLFAEKRTGRLLGAQMAGVGVVGKRIDVLATALHARMTLAEVAALDLTYAPPLAPVYDPVLIAAAVAEKELAK